jgi:hypothetical protein
MMNILFENSKKKKKKKKRKEKKRVPKVSYKAKALKARTKKDYCKASVTSLTTFSTIFEKRKRIICTKY